MEKDDRNTSVPQDAADKSDDVGGRARHDPNTSVPQDEAEKSTSVPQDDK